MPKQTPENTSIAEKIDNSFSIELFNEEESQRIGTNIKELLGIIAQLGSKLPKPVLGVLLGTIFVGAIVGDSDLLQRTGTLWSIIFDPQNLNILLKSVSYAIGLLGVFNMSTLYRKVDGATKSLDADFIVRKTPDSRTEELLSSNILLNAKKLVLEDKINSLQNKIEQDQNFIQGLVGVIQDLSLLQTSSSKVQELIIQAMQYVNNHTQDSSPKKLMLIEESKSLIARTHSPKAVTQSLRALHRPGGQWSKAIQSESDFSSDIESKYSPLSIASR